MPYSGMVGVFDGWSSYGTLTLERGRADRKCEESAVDNRRPLLFDEGESFTLRVRVSYIHYPKFVRFAGWQECDNQISWLISSSPHLTRHHCHH